MEPPPHFFVYVSSSQADDSLQWPTLRRPGDNAVNAKNDGDNSREDDEEGHLVYHVGLVMKKRCKRHPVLILSVLVVVAYVLLGFNL